MYKVFKQQENNIHGKPSKNVRNGMEIVRKTNEKNYVDNELKSCVVLK